MVVYLSRLLHQSTVPDQWRRGVDSRFQEQLDQRAADVRGTLLRSCNPEGRFPRAIISRSPSYVQDSRQQPSIVPKGWKPAKQRQKIATISHFKNSHRKQNKNLATTRTRIHNSSVDPSEIIYNNYDPLYSTFHKKVPKENASTRHIGNKFYKTNVLANFQTSRPNNN